MIAGIVGWGLVILAMVLFEGARARQIALFAALGLLAQAAGSGLVGMLEVSDPGVALWTHLGVFVAFALIGSALPGLKISVSQAGLGLWLGLDLGGLLARGRFPDGYAYAESGAVLLWVAGLAVVFLARVVHQPAA